MEFIVEKIGMSRTVSTSANPIIEENVGLNIFLNPINNNNTSKVSIQKKGPYIRI